MDLDFWGCFHWKSNPKNLDPSCKIDLNFCSCFEQEKQMSNSKINMVDGCMTCNFTSFQQYFSHIRMMLRCNERLCEMKPHGKISASSRAQT